jgi:cephalosporin-C deacetylase-like acetyl esterase
MNIHELEHHSPDHFFYDVGDQLKQHIYRRSEAAFASNDMVRDSITSREVLQRCQQEIREFIVQSLGDLPPLDTPLNARTVGTIEADGFHVEKVIFEARPGNYVTANLYLPAGISEPRGAVLFLCGHHEQAKHADEYQMVCRHFVRAGLIVLAQDPIGQGERFSYYEPSLGGTTVGWGTSEHEYTGLQCWPLGDGIARYFLHDAMRGIDYLRSRPEVDGERIGVTGNSGGGTQTCLMMLADTRIAAAAPATFLMNRETYMHVGGAQDAEQIWPGFTAAGFDHEDILIAMVPRPVRVLAVTSDFFPIEGVRRTVERCKRFWDLSGHEADLDLVEDNSDHHYTPKMARAAAEFFSRHLLGREPNLDEGSTLNINILEPRRLWCTNSGQVRGELEGAVSVYEANQERLAELEAQRNSVPDGPRRERAVQWLKARVENHRQPCELNPRFYLTDRFEELHVQMGLWWSQEKLFNHGYVFRHFERGGFSESTAYLPVTLAIWDGGTNSLHSHLSWIRRTCEQGRAVLVLDVSGSGAIASRSSTMFPREGFFGIMHKLADDLFWLGDDLASLRIYDVLRALTMIEQWPGLNASDIQLYAHGRHGLYGQLAAILDERIQAVEVVDGIDSYAQWISARHYDTHHIKDTIILGALHYFDLPQLTAK